ncbi:MAG TPA: RsbRD N-terminal domain-containing protein [Spirochaetota bacterium]|nr:RsbRD N-terminal domain-containing protein [Spirochaetota bacterium]
MDNSVQKFLSLYRKEIMDSWLESLYSSYHNNAEDLLKHEDDPFLNPVGSTINRSLSKIYDGLISGLQPEYLRDYLDDIIRIRAVQDFTPSQAVSFVFSLRNAVFDFLSKENHDAVSLKSMIEIDAWIDAAAVMGFDIYMECRENIFNLRIREIKKSALRAG